jgi:hypothetical protein
MKLPHHVCRYLAIVVTFSGVYDLSLVDSILFEVYDLAGAGKIYYTLKCGYLWVGRGRGDLLTFLEFKVRKIKQSPSDS